MKKYFLILVVFLFAGITFAGAQNARGQKQVDRIMNNLQQACQPTPGQSSRMLPMVQNFVNIRMQNRKKYAANQDAFRAANQDNMKNFRANLATVLSPQQMQQFKAYMKQQRAQMQQQQRQQQTPSGTLPQPSGTQQ